jgi:cell division protein FtsL
MATTPTSVTTTPATAPTTTTTAIGHWITLVKAHEKLLIVIIAAVTLFHLGNKAYDAYENYLTQKQSATTVQITAQETTNAALQKQIVTLSASIATQAKIDDAKIAAAKASIATKKKANDAMTLPDLTNHWADLIASPRTNFQSIGTTVSVTADDAHKTVDQLEQIPALNDQLNATQDKLNGCTSVVNVDSQLITGLQTSISLEKTGRAEDAKIASVKQKKSWMSGFKIGVVVGFVGGLLTYHTINP